MQKKINDLQYQNKKQGEKLKELEQAIDEKNSQIE
jgi:peptidoglycan hydrolase CwlO-like protein